MNLNKTKAPQRKVCKRLGRMAAAFLLCAFLLLCFLYREKLSVERIVDFVPKNSVLSFIVMLLLFAIKGVAFFIYGGILYAASGILFSLPVAIVVNTVGTVIMTSIPFLIGKKAGSRLLEKLIMKNPKLELLKDIQNKNEFFVCVFLRMVGFLPTNLVATYLGANGMRCKPYFGGTVVGCIPSIVCLSLMGTSIHDASSPQFVISTAVEVGIMVLSVLLYLIWKSTSKRKRECSQKGNEA